MSYQPSQAKAADVPPGKGRISAYALTKDYHQVIWEKLTKLENFIQSQTDRDVHLKSYVDTGPILERDYASLAGIGIAGKNTCLIIPGIGSFFFLAEILTDLELPIDPPYQHDICGSCRRCIDACPTGCILENRIIDAARCISYLTIENTGSISDDLKAKIGDWVFGCDVCQNVCPHNAHSPEQPLPLGNPILPEFIDLLELFSFDEQDFAEKFAKTPLTRAKREGLLRNAAAVIGNQRLAEALPLLRQALEREQNPAVKDACRWAIHQIEQNPQSSSPKQE
jgi:epoxyqueuosine reductase